MSELVPGFRFYPTEEELVSFYLFHKLRAQHDNIDLVIPVVDVYRHEPWKLPGESGTLCRGDLEQWFFFVPQQEREARGGRPTRITSAGYWKATGSPGYVFSADNRIIGLRKTMVFYKGQSPNVQKTKWKMNEYRAIQEERAEATAADESSEAAIPKFRNEYSLCRVYVVSGNFRAFDRRPQVAAATRNINASSHASGGAQGEYNASIDGSMRGTSDDPSSASVIDMDTEWDWEHLIGDTN